MQTQLAQDHPGGPGQHAGEIVGQAQLDQVLGVARQKITEDTRELIQRTLDSYNSGIRVTSVNFTDVQVPEAVLALKQGVGRLVRSESDRGVIVICDPRLTGKGYGRTFRASLPATPVTTERSEATKFLRRMR